MFLKGKVSGHLFSATIQVKELLKILSEEKKSVARKSLSGFKKTCDASRQHWTDAPRKVLPGKSLSTLKKNSDALKYHWTDLPRTTLPRKSFPNSR